MNFSSRHKGWGCWVLLCLLTGTAHSGTVASARFAGPGMALGGESNVQIEIQSGQLRLDIRHAPMNVSFLYNQSDKLLTVVDHSIRAYEEFGSTKRMFMSKTLGMGLKMYQMRLSSLPADQQKVWTAFSTAVKTVFAAEFKKAASGVKTPAGTGVRYECKPGGLVVLNYVTALQPQTALSVEEWAVWKEFCALLADAGEGGLEFFGVAPEILQKWPGVPGFPLSCTWTEGKKRVYSIQVQSLRNQGLSPGDFAVPTGYESKMLITTM